MATEDFPPGRGASLLGSRSFLVVWIGQLVSVLGSNMTGFALVIWVIQKTGAVTPVALLSFFIALASIAVAPLAGVLADRWNRRWVMILSDLGAGLSILALALLLFSNQLQVWQIYLCSSIGALFSALQWPAFTAAITLLVPKRHLARASGMVQTSQGFGQLLSPVIAGVLVVTVGIKWVLVFDFFSFLCSITTLLLVRFPEPPRSDAGAKAAGSMWRQLTFGWSYLRSHPLMIGLLQLSVAMNVTAAFVLVLAAPYLLSFASPAAWGAVSTVGGTGFLVGGLLMSTWGGPKRRMTGILAFEALSAICIVIAGAIPSAVVFAVVAFGFFLCMTVVGSCSQAIWQTKVEADVQGKVFAFRGMVATSCTPIAYLLAGPLADRVFKPLMMPGGALAPTVGRLIGTGPGRGIGLFASVLGLLNLSVVILGFLRLRGLEDRIPDAVPDQMPAAAESPAT
jgi:MFS family permease